MAGTLTFDLAKVRAEIAKAKSATSHNQSLVEQMESRAPVAALWLVGDRGVYLMHNGKRDEEPPFDVIYANECDPIKDPDGWYIVKCAVFGGDDGVDALPVCELERIIASKPHAKVLRLKLSAQSMEISAR